MLQLRRWKRDQFRNELRDMRRPQRSKTGGERGSECIKMKYWKRIKVISTWYWPYQIAYMTEHTEIWRLPQWPFSVSHICGCKTCINPGHIRKEDMRWNVKRCDCHTLIRKWLAAQKRLPRRSRTMQTNEKYFVADVGDGSVCPHRPPCYINVSESHRGRRRNRRS